MLRALGLDGDEAMSKAKRVSREDGPRYPPVVAVVVVALVFELVPGLTATRVDIHLEERLERVW